MLINADFSQRVIVTPEDHRWVPSPQPGVERVMLDRVGDEKARATSLVRYAPGSSFPPHHHPGGEEILVLSGIFSEDGRDYPAGSYLRSPPGSSHRPSSAPGAVIFVKLWQMRAQETRHVRIDTRDERLWKRDATRDVCPLFSGQGEDVRLMRVASNEQIVPDPVPGAETLVIEGEVSVEDRRCPTRSWIRLPAGRYPSVLAGDRGAHVYVKISRPGERTGSSPA